MVAYTAIWRLTLNLQVLLLLARSAEEILYEVAVELHALAVFVIEMVAHNNCIMSGYSVSNAELG